MLGKMTPYCGGQSLQSEGIVVVGGIEKGRQVSKNSHRRVTWDLITMKRRCRRVGSGRDAEPCGDR